MNTIVLETPSTHHKCESSVFKTRWRCVKLLRTIGVNFIKTLNKTNFNVVKTTCCLNSFCNHFVL